MAKPGVIGQLAESIHYLSFNDLPEEVIKNTKFCILDAIGGALGGLQTSEIKKLVSMMTKYDASNDATIWGTPYKASFLMASLLNGTMAHTLEVDDVHREAKAHPGAVIVPASLTLGETKQISGKDLIIAIVCGYEVMLRIGIGVGAASHRKRGWHATGTCGTFGSAASATKILGLSKEQLTSALGLGGAQSFGLWAFTADGAGNKKFHAGRAAESGILAAMLAESGMTGPKYILEAEDGGLFPATSNNYCFDDVTHGLGKRFLINEVSVKPYPCCRSIHPAIDCVLAILQRTLIDVSLIKKITVYTYEVAVKQCGFTNHPVNASQARFSLPYVIAAALIDGKVSLEQFKKSKIQDKDILELAKKVEIVGDSVFTQIYPKKWGCRLQIEMLDGKTFVQETVSPKGDPENPLQWKELTDKFYGLAQEAVGENKCKTIVDMVSNIEDINNVTSLVQLLSCRE